MSLILPAHNEAGRIKATLRTYSRALTQRYGGAVEVLVVANGCTDDTVGVVRALRNELPCIEVLDIREPIGKGGAIMEGFRRARGRAVVFADADGATDASSLIDLVGQVEQSDVAVGSRRLGPSVIERNQPLRRRILSAVFSRTVRLMFRLPIRDTQCGAKAFRLGAAKQLAERAIEPGWTFDLDLLLTARELGLSIVERPVVWRDVSGSSLRVAAVAPAVAASLWRLWRSGRGAGASRAATEAAGPGARSIRILALNWRCSRHLEAGGAELNLFEQARRWRRDGHEVTVVCAQGAEGQRLSATEVLDGIVIRRMGGRFTVYLRAALYLLRHGHEYDRILEVANGIPFFAPLFSYTPGVLLVHHVHGRQWFTEFRRPIADIGWALERFLVPLVYRRRPVIAVSPTTRDALVETGFRAHAITVIYNGVNLPAAKSRGMVPSGQVIAYVGRIKRYKRLELLISAFAELRSQIPGARLDIAGDGDDRPKIERLVRELHLSDSVGIHGFVDEKRKAELLAGATVFATPSMHEGWGLSVIEANVHGCPAVAFDVPGLRSAIVDGQTGILARDHEAFTSALARILNDKPLRGRMSEAAIRWSRRFDWDRSADATLQLLAGTARVSVSGLVGDGLRRAG